MNFSRVDAEGVRYREATIGNPRAQLTEDENGHCIVRAKEPLEPYPARVTDRLIHGAKEYPDRTFVAQRDAEGEWQRISYRDMLSRVRRIGQALLQRNLSLDRPIMILSGNDLEHLQLSLAALFVGVPHSSLSPAASLLSKDFGKLRHMAELLTPGLVYASDGGAFGLAIKSVFKEDVEVLTLDGSIGNLEATSFSILLETEITDVDAANEAVGADTVAKFIFTSGSTKLPKAVTTTHGMLCANQQMLLQTFPCFREEPPVLLDWLPWSHVFGGSHNLGIVLYNGGTLYINDGKPTEQGFKETLRNLLEIAPTVYLDVPKAWEMLGDELEQNAALRDVFYSKVKLFFFAGAGLSQAAWDKLDRISESHCGERIRVMVGLGMTETSPSCLFSTGPLVGAGYVGLPAPGCELKLVEQDGKWEARFKGPHVMPRYWRAPELTQAAFDADGYYCTGDALVFADAAEPELGLVFDGRIAEDFKLSSGTFVSVGPLRAKIISAGSPYVQDVVVTGINRDDVGVLIFPRMEHCIKLAGLGAQASARDILDSGPVQTFFTELLQICNKSATGSASRIERLFLLDTPPSVHCHEATDKGSINQRAVLDNRAEVVEALYADKLPSAIRIN